MIFKTSGSIKKRTQTNSEIGIGSQRNGHWAATSWPCTAIQGFIVCGRAVCRKRLCIN